MNVHIFSHLGKLQIIFPNFVFEPFPQNSLFAGRNLESALFLKTLFSQSLQLSCDTFCLAFSLLDRTIGALKIRKRLIRLLAITCLKIAIKFTEDDKRDNLNRQLCEVSSNQRVPVATLTITQNSYIMTILGLWIPIFKTRCESNGIFCSGEARMEYFG